MLKIEQLLHQIATQEKEFCATQFLAPSVVGGKVRSRVSGLIYTFTIKPQQFTGWGIFQPLNSTVAELVTEADLPQIAEYMQYMSPMRFWLAYALQKNTWLAYPINESDAQQRFGITKPVPIHLVSNGAVFEQIIARWDGGNWWFEDYDRRADPFLSENLTTALKEITLPAKLRFKGMTPEMKIVYQLVTQQQAEFKAKMELQTDAEKLAQALKLGGGELQKFRDRDDYWVVEWTTGYGEHHTSAIAKSDLTVISAGICLSGLDRDFDLSSLVGVVESR